jgi:glycolate oxidase iron-sulfur subunit
LDDQELLRLADQCVKCGLCLPHCPTFRLAHHEADSPRGRIALIQGLIGGQLAESARLAAHLDGCLECRACEVACPSLVQFGKLMDAARAERVARLPAPARWWRRTRLDLLSSGRTLPLLTALAAVYRGLRVGALARSAGLLGRPRLLVLHGLAARLRRPAPVDAGASAAGTAAAPPIALFLGCVARALEPDVMQAAQRVFTALGIPVTVPAGQGCCGAMHRHNGFPDAADGLLAHNRTAFGDATVVGGASACVAELQLALPAVELCRALLDVPWPATAALAPLDGTVAVHEPCSHRNQLRDTEAVYALLRRIPGVQVVPLPGNDTCCGAAGTYLLDHPETALALADAKVAALSALRPRWLATTNTGCAAHLAAAATAAGLDVEVLHPVQLLDIALKQGPRAEGRGGLPRP